MEMFFKCLKIIYLFEKQRDTGRDTSFFFFYSVFVFVLFCPSVSKKSLILSLQLSCVVTCNLSYFWFGFNLSSILCLKGPQKRGDEAGGYLAVGWLCAIGYILLCTTAANMF